MINVPEISNTLKKMQRQRAILIKSRIMQSNRLIAIVAGELGYSSGMAEKDRAAKFAEAAKMIEDIKANPHGSDFDLKNVVLTTSIGIEAFTDLLKNVETGMKVAVRELPIVKNWVQKPEQRGFGELFLAIVVGECNDLSLYANPAKVWRRMGCAPLEFDGQTLMGATWRSGKQGKLPAEKWGEFGYSPRRRSIAYLIGEGIVKQNGDGPYRRRYDEAKEKIQQAHPDYPKQRCHRHGMLLATKLLLKELWAEWNGRPPIPKVKPNPQLVA